MFACKSKAIITSHKTLILEMKMQKHIITILLISQMTWSFASSKDLETLKQEKQDIERIQPSKDLSKQTSGSFITVGGDTLGCQFSNIQDAIDSIPFSGTGEIRIATNKTYNENLIIDDINVSLIGGYADCFRAGLPFAPGNNQVLINGGNAAPVLKILGSFQRSNINLRNLRLIEGLGLAPNNDSAGGGILAYEADTILSVRNIDIRSNDAEYGAGIAIIDGNTDLALYDSRIINNLASYGGGVFCTGVHASIVMTEKSGVVANVANGIPSDDNDINGRAGGLYLRAGCSLSANSGSAIDDVIGIASNIAFGNGGGIYAESSARVIFDGGKLFCNVQACFEGDNTPVNVTRNIAGFNYSAGSGGGIYAKDNNTQLFLSGVLIKDNNANLHGAGILVDNSRLIIDRNSQSCWDNNRCNFFDGNVLNGVSNFSSGGAIYNIDSNMEISFSYFENNQAIQGAAIFLKSSLDRKQTFIHSSVFNHNGGDSTTSLIRIVGAADVELIHTTIADNNIDDISPNSATFDILPTSIARPNLLIGSTIIDNFGTPVLNHFMIDFNVDISCIISSETVSISSNNNLINAADAQPGGSYINNTIAGFLDRNNRDYHLASQSQAIDYCQLKSFSDPFFNVINDIDFQRRGVDDPNIPDLSIDSFYDIGADEYIPLEEVIFENGFE
jgi:predicted outer membrane repeat protein